MANVDGAFGFKVIGRRGGGEPSCRWYQATDSTAIYVGDAVKLAGSANTRGTVPTVSVCAAGDKPVGIMLGVDHRDRSNLDRKYRAASVDTYILVCDDPDAIMEVQMDDAITADNVGTNFDLVAGSGSTTTGFSGFEGDQGTCNTTSTLVFHLDALIPTPDNALGEGNNAICSFNVHQYKSVGVAGV